METKTLQQAFILGLGQISGKIISLIFLFRFANDLGNTGLAFYTYAYVPYSIFADLAAFGFIPGTSKAVAKLKADEEDGKVHYLLKKGTILAILLGIFFFIFLLFFSRQILSMSLFEGEAAANFEEIRFNLLLASISLFLIPFMNFAKGFLQGLMRMYPSCISIVVENIARIFIYILIFPNLSNSTDIIHTVFIVYFIGTTIGLIPLLIFIMPYFFKKKEKFKSLSYLLKISIPYGITTMFFTIYHLVDAITLSVLMPVEGYYAAYMYECIRLIFLPIILAQALGGALNPRINYLYQEKKKEEAAQVAKNSTSMILYILIPLLIIMKYFSSEIYGLFYNQGSGAVILYHISNLILFFGIYKVLIGISLGLPRSIYMIIATMISGIAKYILNYLLIPKFGYQGAIYATEIAISICILCAYFILYKEKIFLFAHNFKCLILSFITCGLSLLFVVFFRMIFLLNHYPVYYSIVLYSILLLGVYYILLFFLRRGKQMSKKASPA